MGMALARAVPEQHEMESYRKLCIYFIKKLLFIPSATFAVTGTSRSVHIELHTTNRMQAFRLPLLSADLVNAKEVGSAAYRENFRCSECRLQSFRTGNYSPRQWLL